MNQKINITISELIKAGVHFGHLTRFRNPKMDEFIYGERQKLHIIDLVQTKSRFEEALTYIRRLAEAKGTIVFVGTKPSAQDAIREFASTVGEPFISRRWPGGLLTNWKTIRGSVKNLIKMEEQVELIRKNPEQSGLTKRERLGMERRLKKLESAFGGLRNMNHLPDALFVIDAKQEHIAIREANKLGIPVIAVVDTNSTPEGVDFVIPGNDDAISAIQLYCRHVAGVIKVVADERAAAQAKAPANVSRSGKTVVTKVVKSEKSTKSSSPVPSAAEEKTDDVTAASSDAKPKAKRVVAKKSVTVAKPTADEKKASLAKKSSAAKPKATEKKATAAVDKPKRVVRKKATAVENNESNESK